MKSKLKKRRVSKGNLFINTIVILVILFFCFFFLFIPKVRLNSSYEKIVNINSSYNDSGVTINDIFGNKKIIKGVFDIDTTRIVNYNVSYTYHHNIFTYHLYIPIMVRDIEKPKITLKGNTIEYYCPSKEYIESGYSAYDNVDLDITSKVKIKKEKDKIIYEVEDSSSNKSEVIRKIISKDTIKPTITLKGDNNIFLPLNNEYVEYGFNVLDNCDSDLTSRVKIFNNIDSTKVGNYYVKYNVKDSNNNKSYVLRNVKVREPLKNNTIYLTFDDGPRDGTTDKILDILKEKNVRATFFVTSNGDDSLIKRIVDEGHSICIHTASHRYDIIYASVDNYFNDLEIVKKRIYDVSGVESNLIRFPGGSSNTVSKKYNEGIMSTLTKEVINKGYQYYDWNIDSGDSSSNSSTLQIYNNVINNLSHDKYNVVLMHDTKKFTKDTLAAIIDYAKEKGYSFDVLTDELMPLTQRVNN